jgi:hypothetical protein
VIALLQSLAKLLPPESADVVEDIAAQNLPRILDAAEAGLIWMRLRDAHAVKFVEAAWSTPTAPLRTSLATGLTFLGRLRTSRPISATIMVAAVAA